jgi:hypothetical protein
MYAGRFCASADLNSGKDGNLIAGTEPLVQYPRA